MFANYRKWCDRMGTAPLFNQRVAGKRHVGFIEDLTMFLLVWGEAANLRHLPESLCFIYHKMMDEHLAQKYSGKRPRTTYPGYFLDMVVTPMYEVVAADVSKDAEHENKRTYDDFNEFFWAPSCLHYRIFDSSGEGDEELGGGSGSRPGSGFGASANANANANINGAKGAGANNGETGVPHVSRGMQLSRKTYVEKRSWLHPLQSMHRVFEWHVLTFSLLAAWAFSEHLQWNYSFTIQVASFVFWQITCMSILWTVLEVWTLVPNVMLPTASVLGFLLRLIAGYLVLCYQSVYLHWSFRTLQEVADANALGGSYHHLQQQQQLSSSLPFLGSPPAYVTSASETSFYWWWQYVWLSLGALCIYFAECLMCYYPAIVSTLLTWNNDVLQSLLNICYPFSQLYVGKKLDVPAREVAAYIFYWLTLISFKLWFGYRFIVHPVTVPSLELYDDYMNFQRISFYKTSVLMFVWWFPHFLVYLIDLSIWYSMWSSLSGGLTALADRQGAVRSADTFRQHFMRSPLSFYSKFMSNNNSSSSMSYQRKLSTASMANLEIVPVNRGGGVPEKTKIPPRGRSGSGSGLKAAAKSKSSADLHLFEFSSVAQATGGSPPNEASGGAGGGGGGGGAGGSGGEVRAALGDFLGFPDGEVDERSLRWIIFGKAWNQIVENLRRTDHLSDAEKDNFLFSTFDWLPKPIYLPLYQTAGCVETAITAIKTLSEEYNAEPSEAKKRALLVDNTLRWADDNTTLLTTKEAVSEAWELLWFVLKKLLGPNHQAFTNLITDQFTAWVDNQEVFGQFNFDKIENMSATVGNIVGMLKGVVGKRRASPVVTEEVLRRLEEKKSGAAASSRDGVAGSSETGAGKPVGMKKSVSTGFLPSLNPTSAFGGGGGAAGSEESPRVDEKGAVVTTTARYQQVKPMRREQTIIDQTRDKLREQVKAFFAHLKEGRIFDV